MFDYEIGQQVVCIDDRVGPDEPGPYVVKGCIYTICDRWVDEMFMDVSCQRREQVLVLAFAEFPPLTSRYQDSGDFRWSSGYDARVFRPLRKQKFDISVFTDMQTKTPERV
jgi:hypothetical protein